MSRIGHDTPPAQVYRECLEKASEWHSAQDALRLLLKSQATRAALEDALRIYQEPLAWPLRSCFPLPIAVEKKVFAFPAHHRSGAARMLPSARAGEACVARTRPPRRASGKKAR